MEKVKAFIVAVWGAVLGFLGVLAVPVFLLVGCNLIDYITAFLACNIRAWSLRARRVSGASLKKF